MNATGVITLRSPVVFALTSRLGGRIRSSSLRILRDKNDPARNCSAKRSSTSSMRLALPRYGLSTYLKADAARRSHIARKAKLIDDLSRAGRRLKGFCRINLFKRLESSAHAFLLSLHRHILRNELFIHALENSLLFRSANRTQRFWTAASEMRETANSTSKMKNRNCLAATSMGRVDTTGRKRRAFTN